MRTWVTYAIGGILGLVLTIGLHELTTQKNYRITWAQGPTVNMTSASQLAHEVRKLRSERAVILAEMLKLRAPLVVNGPSRVFEVTAYGIGCDAPGPFTSAGIVPKSDHTAAADPVVVPRYSVIHVEGLGEFTVLDTGGAVKGRVIDIFVDDCEFAKSFGRPVKQVRRVK